VQKEEGLFNGLGFKAANKQHGESRQEVRRIRQGY